MKKSLLLSLFLSFILILSGGSIQTTAQTVTPSTPIDPIDISVIAKGQAPFWSAVKLGVETAAKDYGVQAVFEAPPRESPPDIITQLNLLRRALAKKPEVIALAAINSKVVTPFLEQARDAGIPVIGFDSGVDSPIVKTTVATDNYAAGQLAAHKMAELINEEGKAALIVQDQTSQSALDRNKGFSDTLKEKYPNIELLPVQNSLGDIERAALLTKELILANPDIKGIFATNEGTSEGVINVVCELNKAGQIKVIGFDSGKALLDGIREGIVSGAITQNPIAMGYKTIETAIKAYNGEALPTFIDTGFEWYDKSNMDSPEISPLLYE